MTEEQKIRARAREKAWREANRDRINARRRKRRAENPEAARAEWAKYNRTEASREKARRWRKRNPPTDDQKRAALVYISKWKRNNPDRVSEYNARDRQRHPTRMLEWQRANKDKCADYKRRRRAARMMVENEPVSLDSVFSRDNGICGICGLPVDRSSASVDHVIPLSRGGPHLYSNVQLAHRSCNSKKNTKLPCEMARRSA